MQAVHQSSAVLGLGLIGMAEDLGTAMAHRALEHLLQYGDTAVRSALFDTFLSKQLYVCTICLGLVSLGDAWVHGGHQSVEGKALQQSNAHATMLMLHATSPSS